MGQTSGKLDKKNISIKEPHTKLESMLTQKVRATQSQNNQIIKSNHLTIAQNGVAKNSNLETFEKQKQVVSINQLSTRSTKFSASPYNSTPSSLRQQIEEISENDFASGEKQFENKPKDYTAMMNQRWTESIQCLPEMDQIDAKNMFFGTSTQFCPEFSQQMYQQLLIKEKYAYTGNYLKEASPQRNHQCMNSNIRDKAVLRIIDLCMKKDYRKETMFLAIAIFDKFFSEVYQKIQNPENYLPCMTVAVTIIAAKMEQPIQPSMNRMIRLLPLNEQEMCQKPFVIQMETTILTYLDFNVILITPFHFLERYMRLLGLEHEEQIKNIAVELCIRAMTKSIFLDFRPSIIAATALLLSLNLNSEQEIQNFEENLNVWNQKIEKLSGYKLYQFKETYILMATLFTDIDINEQRLKK